MVNVFSFCKYILWRFISKLLSSCRFQTYSSFFISAKVPLTGINSCIHIFVGFDQLSNDLRFSIYALRFTIEDIRFEIEDLSWKLFAALSEPAKVTLTDTDVVCFDVTPFYMVLFIFNPRDIILKEHCDKKLLLLTNH